MKQNLILVFVLLAMLSMVNAIPHQLHKRVTTFVPCSDGSPNAITVTIKPDPPAVGGQTLFSISGTMTTGTIEQGAKLVVGALDTTGTNLFTPVPTDFCAAVGGCPVATGNSFSVIATVTLPATLPATYTLGVLIVDAAGTIIACAAGPVTGA